MMLQSDSQGEKLVDDGSIVKVLLSAAPAEVTQPKWEKGANAKFHYIVHAYVVESITAAHSEACDHEHHNHSNCHSHSSRKHSLKSDIERKRKALEGLLNHGNASDN
jgi:hypothetical protein